MRADEVLREALASGDIEQSKQVTSHSHPAAARSYLSDATGMAWNYPEHFTASWLFALDAEIVQPVRPSLRRRFGIGEPTEFARRWTRAEVWAKLFDVPIITWVSRHGLDEPAQVSWAHDHHRLSWQTVEIEDLVCTFGVVVKKSSGG